MTRESRVVMPRLAGQDLNRHIHLNNLIVGEQTKTIRGRTRAAQRDCLRSRIDKTPSVKLTGVPRVVTLFDGFKTIANAPGSDTTFRMMDWLAVSPSSSETKTKNRVYQLSRWSCNTNINHHPLSGAVEMPLKIDWQTIVCDIYRECLGLLNLDDLIVGLSQYDRTLCTNNSSK